MEQFPHEHESSAKYNFQTKPVRYNKSFNKMRCWKSIHAMNINQQCDKELTFLRFDQFNMEEDSENLFFNNLYQLMDQSIFFFFLSAIYSSRSQIRYLSKIDNIW